MVKDLEKFWDRLEVLIKYRGENEHLQEIYESTLVVSIKEAKEKINRNKNRTIRNLDPNWAPNDISEVSIVPTLQEILSDQDTFLRRNITNGAYKSIDH